jgi:hypothetical protein
MAKKPPKKSMEKALQEKPPLPKADFHLHQSNPHDPLSLVVTPKAKRFNPDQKSTITFLNLSDHPVLVFFPGPLEAKPNPLYVLAHRPGQAEIDPWIEGDFQCWVELPLEVCPTCKSSLDRDRAVHVRPRCRLKAANGDGGDDADPIIIIKPEVPDQG